MIEKKLCELCNPKQWKTISSNKLIDDGYPVYGANGVIGYYNEYNHENRTILITCRGATCGTINICEPFSYVNGNAMALDDLSPDIELKYLFYYLTYRGMKDVITGSAQPQIVRQSLNNVKITYPLLEEQHKIAETLDKVSDLIAKRKQQLEKLDLLVKSKFVEMFGNPENNSNNFQIEKLSKYLNVIGGYAFKSVNFLDVGIPILRIGNINSGHFKPVNMVFWKEDFTLEKYKAYPNDLVMSLTGTVGKDDYGNVCILGNEYDEYYLNQRNAKLQITGNLNKWYLMQILKFPSVKSKLTGISRGVRQANISNGDILNLCIPIPPIELQNQFADFVQQTEKTKTIINQSLEKLETLKKALMQEYFG